MPWCRSRTEAPGRSAGRGRDSILETFGILGSDVEGLFEGDAGASEGAFVEEATDEGNAVGGRARGLDEFLRACAAFAEGAAMLRQMEAAVSR